MAWRYGSGISKCNDLPNETIEHARVLAEAVCGVGDVIAIGCNEALTPLLLGFEIGGFEVHRDSIGKEMCRQHDASYNVTIIKPEFERGKCHLSVSVIHGLG